MIDTRRRLWLAGIVVLAALGFLVFQGLGNATLYFRTCLLYTSPSPRDS